MRQQLLRGEQIMQSILGGQHPPQKITSKILPQLITSIIKISLNSGITTWLLLSAETQLRTTGNVLSRIIIYINIALISQYVCPLFSVREWICKSYAEGASLFYLCRLKFSLHVNTNQTYKWRQRKLSAQHQSRYSLVYSSLMSMLSINLDENWC